MIGDTDRLDRKKVHAGVVLGMERTLDQDVAYGFRLLVDMAERSLSDSRWQDPTTAVQAIDRLHDCLRQLARRPIPDGTFRDSDGEPRLIQKVMSWEAYVHLALDEIRLAGAGSPQVARRLRSALLDLRSIAPEDRRVVLDEQLDLLSEGTAEAMLAEADVLLAQTADAGGGAGLGSAGPTGEDIAGRTLELDNPPGWSSAGRFQEVPVALEERRQGHEHFAAVSVLDQTSSGTGSRLIARRSGSTTGAGVGGGGRGGANFA